MEWYLKVLGQYADFSGRARRKEYWMFTLFHAIAAAVLSVIDIVLFDDPSILYGLYILATLIPSLAVSVRRLHDIGKSGWWYLIILIPIFGGLMLFIFSVMDSEPGSNNWGPNPKEKQPLKASFPQY